MKLPTKLRAAKALIQQCSRHGKCGHKGGHPCLY